MQGTLNSLKSRQRATIYWVHLIGVVRASTRTRGRRSSEKRPSGCFSAGVSSLFRDLLDALALARLLKITLLWISWPCSGPSYRRCNRHIRAIFAFKFLYTHCSITVDRHSSRLSDRNCASPLSSTILDIIHPDHNRRNGSNYSMGYVTSIRRKYKDETIKSPPLKLGLRLGDCRESFFCHEISTLGHGQYF